MYQAVQNKHSNQSEKVKYHAYVAGFSRIFNNLAELRAWANDLNAKYCLQGKVLKIHQSVKVIENKDGYGFSAVYSGKSPYYREILIGN